MLAVNLFEEDCRLCLDSFGTTSYNIPLVPHNFSLSINKALPSPDTSTIPTAITFPPHPTDVNQHA